MKKLILAALLLAASTGLALAHDYHAGALTLGHPWARPAPSGATTGAGYLTITNTGASADRLTGGSTPAAARLEIHEMSMAGGVMRMRPVSGGLDIPAGATVALKPGGYHVMLIGLKRPLNVGDRIPATLTFQRAGTVKVEFQVQGAPAGGGHDHMEMH